MFETDIINLQMKEKIPRVEAIDKILEKSPQYEDIYNMTTSPPQASQPPLETVQVEDNFQVVQSTGESATSIPSNTTTTVQTTHVGHNRNNNNKTSKDNKKPPTTSVTTRNSSQQSYSGATKKQTDRQQPPSTPTSQVKRKTTMVNYEENEEDGIYMSIDYNNKRTLTSPKEDRHAKKSNLKSLPDNSQRSTKSSYRHPQQWGRNYKN